MAAQRDFPKPNADAAGRRPMERLPIYAAAATVVICIAVFFVIALL